MNNTHCVVRFNLAADEPIVDWDAALPYECDASAPLAAGALVDLAPWFASLGVDVDLVRQDNSLARHVVGGSGAPSVEDVRAAMAGFVAGFAYTWGWIEGNDANGSPFAVRFRTRLRLGEPLPEAPVHASAAYDAILESSRENYEMRVPISHEVSPGKVDRFTIRVAAPAASRHRFRLRLRFNESGLVESQPIELHVFMTRYDVDLLHKGDHAPTELRHPSGRTMRRRAEP